jgi:NitT/TauT family transport system permease protein
MMFRRWDAKPRELGRLLKARIRGRWVDPLLFLAGCAVVYELAAVGREWTGVHRPAVAISLSPWLLPQYTLLSLARGLVAYGLSLAFTLVYAYWAAKDPRAERLLIPLLDILQSIPVLGFMPGLVLALAALFPRSNVGLELAAVIMIFTGQAWNMTFSLYHSLKSVPPELQEAATVYRFSWWQRLKWTELPAGVTALAWNSMMSMAGGWFFLMINESFVLGSQDFRLPGLGSYMKVAADAGDVKAMACAILAMVVMIVGLDQVVWRPIVVWAKRFRIEDTAGTATERSWVLTLLRRSRLLRRLELWRARRRRRQPRASAPTVARPQAAERLLAWAPWLATASLATLLGVLAIGSFRLFRFLSDIAPATWVTLLLAGGTTLGRVLVSTLLGTLWAVPAGLAIGLSPRLSRWLQPVVQVAASFPAPMLFPAAIAVLHLMGVGLGAGSIVLMLLGTQWYILFNVVAGASSVPSDLRECARSFGLTRRQRLVGLYLPAVFPYLVTGWVTAAGGAWNASIVSEYVTHRGETITTFGLGAIVTRAAEHANFPLLAAAVLLMATLVVAFNRLVWRPCYALAATRYSLAK